MSLPFENLINFYWAQYDGAVALYQQQEIQAAADKLKTIVTNPVVPIFCRASSLMLLALCNWKSYDLAKEYLSKAETVCEEVERIDMSPKVEVYIQSTRRYQEQLEASKASRPAVASNLSGSVEDDSARSLGFIVLPEDTDAGPAKEEELIVRFAAGSVVGEKVLSKSYDMDDEDTAMPDARPELSRDESSIFDIITKDGNPSGLSPTLPMFGQGQDSVRASFGSDTATSEFTYSSGEEGEPQEGQ